MSTPPETSPPSSPLPVAKAAPQAKVIVRFRAVGNAPILKKSVFKISDSSKFQAVISFLRKELGLKKDESLFLYVNQAFSPSPDEILSNLHKCFQTEGQLIISYCTSAAYG